VPLRYVQELTAREQAALNELYKTSQVVELVHRSHAVLLSADGWSAAKIAELLRVDQATVHRWLDRFEAEGLAGLSTQWSAGRPPIWDESYEWLLVETVRHDPRWYRLEQSLWTCSLLAGYLADQTGVRLSAERVRVLLHQHGIHLSAHKRSADFQQFVDEQILPAYSAADLIFLIVDGASIYKSKSTLAWLKERQQIVLVPLPSYAPKLNLQEQVWRWLRAEVTPHHFFGSLDAALAAAKHFFAKAAEQPDAVLRRIGLAVGLLERTLAKIT
jgi:transposase